MKTPVIVAAIFLITARAHALPATVEVVGADAKPIAGADVQFESFGEPTGTFVKTTDETGRVVFEVQPSPTYRNFLGRIVVWKAGFALAGGRLNLAKKVAERATKQIELQPAQRLSGTVTDQTGQPIEGALVSYRLIGLAGDEKLDRADEVVLFDGPLLERVQTRSDATGKWQFDSLPAGGVAAVTAVARGTLRMQSKAQVGSATELKLAPGAIARGKVVGPNGAPLEGITVMAQGTNPQSDNMWGEAKTGADGSYELFGLGSGEFNISFYQDKKAPYVFAARESSRTRVGETLELGETHAQTGFEIGGTVRDEAGQSVAGAEIGVYGPRRPASSAAVDSATSDKDGRWKLRTLAGPNKIYLMGAPNGFNRDSQERNETLDGARADFDFVLSRTVPIRGTVVDEAGQPAKVVLFGRNGDEGEGFFINPGADGTFEAQAPKAGAVNLATNQPYEATSDWEIVGPNTIKAPADGVKIVVRPRKFETWTIGARDSDGQPVEGVRAEYYYQGKDYNSQTFVSDASGALQIRKPLRGEQIGLVKASKSGFDFLGGGEIVKGAPTDLKLAPRDGVLRGHITVGEGTSVEGARVWAWKAETRSDQNGDYELKNLAHEPGEAIALRGDLFGRGTREIRLDGQTLQAQDKARARQIAAQLGAVKLPDLSGRPIILPLESLADWEARRPAPEKGDSADYARQSRLEAALQVPAVSTDRLLIEAREIEKPEVHLDFAGELWRARHGAPDFDAAPFRADRPALQKLAGAVTAGNDSWTGLRALLGLAAIEDGLGDSKTALQTFDAAAKWLWRQGDQPGDGSVVTPDSILGQNSDAVGDSELLLNRINVLLDRESEGRFYYLKNRARLAATSGGLTAAQPYLTELRGLLQGPQPPGVRISRPAFYAEIIRDLVASTAASAPEVALELARSIPAETDTHQNERAEAIARAALALPLDQARPLWRDNVESIALPGRALGLVSQIKARDAQLAQTLYLALKARIDQPNPNELWAEESPQMSGKDVETFAFYEADFDPASARFRLEQQWSNPQSRTREAVRAIARLDATRALEWAGQLPALSYEPNPDFWARRDVAAWLDADETQRQKLAPRADNY